MTQQPAPAAPAANSAEMLEKLGDYTIRVLRAEMADVGAAEAAVEEAQSRLLKARASAQANVRRLAESLVALGVGVPADVREAVAALAGADIVLPKKRSKGATGTKREKSPCPDCGALIGGGAGMTLHRRSHGGAV